MLPRALGLPRDPVAAAHALAHGHTRRISLGRVNGRRFGFNAGVGLDAELVRRVDALGRKPDGRRAGDSAFVREGVKTFAAHRFQLRPTLELVGVGRAALRHGRERLALHVRGLASDSASHRRRRSRAASTSSRPSASRLLTSLGWWAVGRGSRHVRLHDADRFEIRCDVPLPLQVDGEDLGDVEEASFEAERDAVTVLV